MGNLVEIFNRLSLTSRKWIIAAGFMLLQVIIWLLLFEALWFGDKAITDTPVYYDYAGRMVRGLVPYRDFASEYPPVAMLLFWLPRLISGQQYNEFVFWFEMETLLISCGVVALITAVSWKLRPDLRRLATVLALYTLFVVSIGSIVEARFDMAAALLVLACLAAFIHDRRTLAWMIIGLGLMTKVIPVLVGPLLLIAHYRRGQYREMLTGPAAAVLVTLLIALPFLIMSPSGLAETFLYHAERPLQIESSLASPLLLLSQVSGVEVEIFNSYGSHNVFATGAEALAQLSGPISMALLLLCYWLYSRRGFKAEGDGFSPLMLVRFAAIVIGVFIFTGKVFSPQFLIWLLPLIPLVTSRDHPWPGALYWVILVLTQWEFPYRYWQLYLLEPGLVFEVAIRNALLGVLVVVMLAITRPRPGDARSP